MKCHGKLVYCLLLAFAFPLALAAVLAAAFALPSGVSSGLCRFPGCVFAAGSNIRLARAASVNSDLKKGLTQVSQGDYYQHKKNLRRNFLAPKISIGCQFSRVVVPGLARGSMRSASPALAQTKYVKPTMLYLG